MQGYEKIIYFYLFAFMRNAYQTRYGVIDPITNLVIGYVSNWCQLPFTMPVDTCVNGMITTGRSFGTMVKTVLANPAGAYKGMAAYSIAALNPAIQFTVYEQMRWSAEPAQSSLSSASELDSAALAPGGRWRATAAPTRCSQPGRPSSWAPSPASSATR